jgi:hypothetical protein
VRRKRNSILEASEPRTAAELDEYMAREVLEVKP